MMLGVFVAADGVVVRLLVSWALWALATDAMQ